MPACYGYLIRSRSCRRRARHRRERELRLIGGLRVALDLPQRLVAGDRRDLVHGTARLGQTTRGGLSQPVERAARFESRLLACGLEPVSEGVTIERRAAQRLQ